MNSNRDPFNLRRKSPAAQLFRSTSNSSLHNQETTSHRSATNLLSIDTTNGVQHNTSAIASNSYKMSGYGIPNGAAAAHSHDNWQSSGRSRFQHGSHIDASTNPGLSEKVGDTIGGMFRDGKKESLPMYKDKPSNFYGPGGRNARQWLRRKRTLGGVLGVFAVLSWWFGILSPLSWFSSGSGDLPAPVQSSLGSGRQQRGWGLWGGKEPVDWDERAQRVKEAFQISWAGYEKYGWGTYRQIVCPPEGGDVGSRTNAERAQATMNTIRLATLASS